MSRRDYTHGIACLILYVAVVGWLVCECWSLNRRVDDLLDHGIHDAVKAGIAERMKSEQAPAAP